VQLLGDASSGRDVGDVDSSVLEERFRGFADSFFEGVKHYLTPALEFILKIVQKDGSCVCVALVAVDPVEDVGLEVLGVGHFAEDYCLVFVFLRVGRQKPGFFAYRHLDLLRLEVVFWGLRRWGMGFCDDCLGLRDGFRTGMKSVMQA
jgi:hypothetical protein